MKPLTLCKIMLATCVAITSMADAKGQGVTAGELLNGGTNCFHVIRLIQIYGVNNSFDVAGAHVTAQHSPFGAYAVPSAEMGDLEICGVARLPHADPACGPKFNVTIRNNSCRDVCNFHVTVVGTLGRLFPQSPNTTVCVEKICAGATADVCVQLPIEALALGNHNGQVIGFQKLIVVIDSLDQLAETNEANNIRALACGEIPVAAPAVVESTTTVEETTTVQGTAAVQGTTTVQGTVTTQTQGTQVVPPANAAPAAPATGQPAVAPNGQPAAPAPQAGTSADSLRSAIRMMDQPETKEAATAATN